MLGCETKWGPREKPQIFTSFLKMNSNQASVLTCITICARRCGSRGLAHRIDGKSCGYDTRMSIESYKGETRAGNFALVSTGFWGQFFGTGFESVRLVRLELTVFRHNGWTLPDITSIGQHSYVSLRFGVKETLSFLLFLCKYPSFKAELSTWKSLNKAWVVWAKVRSCCCWFCHAGEICRDPMIFKYMEFGLLNMRHFSRWQLPSSWMHGNL